MRVNVAFRHMEASDRIRAHALEKLARIARFEDGLLHVDAVFSAEKFHRTAEFRVNHGHGPHVVSETRADMFEAIDVAIDRLDALLARDKDRRKHHKGAPSSDLAASGLAGSARPFGPATEL